MRLCNAKWFAKVAFGKGNTETSFKVVLTLLISQVDIKVPFNDKHA